MLSSHLSNSLADQPLKPNYTTSSTLDAGTQLMTVDSGMPVNDASGQVTERSLATLKRDLVLELQTKHNILEGNDFFSKSSAD